MVASQFARPHHRFHSKLLVINPAETCALRTLAFAAALVTFTCWPVGSIAAGGQNSPLASASLLEALERIAGHSGGRVGVFAVHIESGQRVSLHGDERFPMGSVYKLPIAVRLFQLVERGDVNLTDMVRLSERDYRPGHSPLALSTNARPHSLSVGELLEWMLKESDNTACDAILRLVGGPTAVTRRLRELGITGIKVNRPEALLSADFSGVYHLPPESEWSLQLFRQLFAQVSEADQRTAEKRFAADPRDTSTPEAMTELLVRLQRGEVVKAPSLQRMLQLMTSTNTGPERLKGDLPAGTIVAHKTGSMGAAATNDAGIVTLPNGRGHLAIAVFVKASAKDLPDREGAIAAIARKIYDYFVSLDPEASRADSQIQSLNQGKAQIRD